MPASANLQLPYIAAAQAQKHVTHNEAVRMLDALVHLAVLSRTLATPPPSPQDGDRYIVATSPTGAWSGRASAIAAWQDGAWAFLTPRSGWRAWVIGEGGSYFDGTTWVSETSTVSFNPVPLVGVNATADAGNRLAVASPAVLLNHAGAGHQLKINKAAAGDTASLLLQTAFSGRAESGLTGDDDFHIKVSANGTAWTEALVIDRTSGRVSLPATPVAGQRNLLINGDFQINQRGFAGGTLASAAYGHDRWKALGGAAQYTVAGDVVTLQSGRIGQIVELKAQGLSSLAGQTVTVSVENPTGAALTVTVGSVTGMITAGSGRRGVALALGAVTGPTVTVSLEAATGAVSFARVKLEVAPIATPWISIDHSLEQLRCQRYYWRIAGPISLFLYAQGAGNYFFNSLALPVRMRVTPSCSRLISASGNIFQNDLGNVSASGLSDNTVRLSVRSNGAGECYANISDIQCDAEL